MHRSLLPLTLAFASTAHALEVRCVDTVNELSNALEVAADDEVEIRIVTGTYNVSQTCFDANPLAACDEPDNDIRIRGGYNANCSARSQDPGLTVITNPNRDIGYEELGFPEINLSIDRVTFRQFRELRLELEGGFSGNYRLAFDRVWVDQFNRVLINADTVSVRNSVFSRGTGTIGVVLSYYVDNLTFDQNTLVDNNTALFCQGCRGIARNNVFGDNTLDISASAIGDDTVALTLINNSYQTINPLDPLDVAPQGTSSANPLFVNLATQNYRLQNTSPAINSGSPIGLAQSGSDHDGGVRWFGDLPDRGAFESSVGTTSSTITVTNVSDAGAGSLRQAIADANVSSNLNRIHFNIGSSCGPRIINLDTPLPAITGPVVIDGYTQPGSARNTAPTTSNAVRCIGLNGQGSVLNGMSTDTDATVGVTVDGLGFGGFTLIALNLTGGNGHRLIGSQFGGQIGPASNLVTLAPSVNAVQVGSLFGGSAAAGVEIGDDDAAARNVFSDSSDAAIRIGAGARNARIVNNYIGVGSAGNSTSEANRDGIVVSGRYTQIARNTISNSTRHGILVTGSTARGTEISENRIGISATCPLASCSNAYGNTEDGIRVQNSAADAVIDANQIRFSGDDGVVITDDAVRIAVLRNTITGNGEQPIDLSDDGASQNTNNSIAPPAGSGNFRQNRPLISRVFGIGTAAAIANGTLTSANGTYRIDFYAAIDCPLPIFFGSGSPQTWLGASYTTISNGTASFDGSAGFAGLLGVVGDSNYFGTSRLVAATATRMPSSDPDSQPRSTSEVSSCVRVLDDLIFQNGFE
jgi:hypothetical protein